MFSERILVNRACGLVRTREEIVEIISLHYFLSAFCKNSLIQLRILKEFTQKAHKFPLGNCY